MNWFLTDGKIPQITIKTTKIKKEKEKNPKNIPSGKNISYLGAGATGTLDDTCLWAGGCSASTNIRILEKLWTQFQKSRNKNMKIYNGNGKKCISVMYWNLGPSFWDKKREEVQLLADSHNPDYLFISEANLFADTPEDLTDIEGYELIMSKTMSKWKFSRIVLLVKDSIWG